MELSNTIIELDNPVDVFNRRLYTDEEKSSKLKDISEEIHRQIQKALQVEKIYSKKKQEIYKKIQHMC